MGQSQDFEGKVVNLLWGLDSVRAAETSKCRWLENKALEIKLWARHKNLEITNTGDCISLENGWHKNLCRLPAKEWN